MVALQDTQDKTAIYALFSIIYVQAARNNGKQWVNEHHQWGLNLIMVVGFECS
jgi:hypothetical protein